MSESLIRARLFAPFLPTEHEEHQHFGLIYLERKALIRRMTRVLGITGWGFETIGDPIVIQAEEPVVKLDSGRKDKYNNPIYATHPLSLFSQEKQQEYLDSDCVVYDIPAVMQRGRLKIRIKSDDGSHTETSYDEIGGDALLSLGKERGVQMMNTYKGATTDCLKRCATAAGLGLYLQQLPKKTTLANIGIQVLAPLGYQESVQAAGNAFLKGTGMKKDMENFDTELAQRSEFRKVRGYTDYDLQTIGDYMVQDFLNGEW